MLKNYIENGYGVKEDLSCSETILYGANQTWKLGLDKNALKMAAGLSRGLYIESVCGALSAGAMVLSRIYIEDRAHESTRNGDLVKELIEEFRKLMGSEICSTLRENHRTEKEGCKAVICAAAGILDGIIEREGIPEGE